MFLVFRLVYGTYSKSSKSSSNISCSKSVDARISLSTEAFTVLWLEILSLADEVFLASPWTDKLSSSFSESNTAPDVDEIRLLLIRLATEESSSDPSSSLSSSLDLEWDSLSFFLSD